MKSTYFLSRAARKSQHSMALVLTLAILALMSILLVSFVSMAARDRGATHSYSESLQADQVALGGLDVIVSQIRAEVADPQLNASGSAAGLYVPRANTNAVPQRMTVSAPNFATLIAYSGTSLYTSGTGGATNFSSGSSTAISSFNGRVISTARWNKPQLMTSTSSPTTFPTPQWVLVARTGPQSFPSYNNTLGDSSANNGNFIVGRYAYTVYDTSGLLDANVAGYPASAASSATGKGLMPYADLTQLTGIQQTDVDALIAWRNAGSAANYAAYVTNSAATNGFTRVANGDTTFLSRQELIKYAQQPGNSDWVQALPYLTTFSRELNGPTWGPTTPAGTYAANQYTSGSFNPRIPNPRVQTTFTRANGIQAVVGEPLVKYRFPLDKLALLEKFTGAGTLTAADILDIQKYFGLDLAPDSSVMVSPQGKSFRHWIYPTANSAYPHNVVGTSGASGIMSLADVAAQNRDPDFFELLQAGILSGSLGAPGNGNKGRSDQYPASANGSASFIDPDDKATLQILRIGANIIDQWGSGNWPTTVTYTPIGGKSSDVQGIKDLPYPYAAYLNFYAPNWGSTGTTGTYSTPLPPFNFFLYFGLWNPHQMPTSASTNYPTNFRFYPYTNTITPANSDTFLAGFANSRVLTNYPPAPVGYYKNPAWFYYGPKTAADTKNGSSNNHTVFGLTALATSGIPFSYSPTNPTTDYREPTLAVTNSPVVTGPTAPWNTIACLSLPALTNFPVSGAGSNQGTSVNFPTNVALGMGSPDGAWQCQYYLQMVMPVQYQDLAGNWHTYSTFIGMDDQTGAYPYETGYYNYGGTSTMTATATLSCSSLVKSDPRTFRFGVSQTSGTANVNVPLSGLTGMVTPVTVIPPFGMTASAAAPYRMDMWAANKSSVPIVGNASGSATTAFNPYYTDVDGVQRQGDAANSYALGTPTSPLFANETANRPVILNRPFRSVGELGYAYRDEPWKTLDLFSANSADSGLLDLFTLSDAPILAGRVNPNTPYSQVIATLISGATTSSTGTISTTAASNIASAMTNTTAALPFVNRADLVNNFMTNSAVTGMSAIKTEEEAAVRSVAESSNTRTWNFMIDIIAQSGRYPTSATSFDNFVVEGERRYWLHIAVDRYTGQIVDKQIEAVNE